MAEITRLEPKTRPECRDYVIQYLYNKDAEGAAMLLSGIIDDHCQITGHMQRAFMFYGKVYQPNITPPKLIAPPLHESLHERMWAYVKDRQVVEREEKLIVKNLLTAVFNVSDSYKDWLRILPPAVHEPIEQFFTYRWTEQHEAILTEQQVEAFQNKQERFLNMLKGRLALNLIF